MSDDELHDAVANMAVDILKDTALTNDLNEVISETMDRHGAEFRKGIGALGILLGIKIVHAYGDDPEASEVMATWLLTCMQIGRRNALKGKSASDAH